MTTQGNMMIKRINIKKFGCFSEFNWKSAFKEGQTIHEFKRLNILYGRNYSGKTTLSRIFRSYEVGRLPEKFDRPEFEIESDGKTLSQRDIQEHELDIRVYNKDFINENLSFLKDHSEGEVKTFAIIGIKNKEIETQIDENERRLGNVDDKSGLRYELAQKNEGYLDKKGAAKQADEALEGKLRQHANNVIKPDRTFGDPGYNINRIKKDIAAVREKSFHILSEEGVRHRQNLLQEKSLPDIDVTVSFHPKFSAIRERAKEILSKEIKPSKPIQDLLNDSLLQSWAQTGMEYHREKRSTCGFCGQTLPDDLWEKLDAHFSRESAELKHELARQIGAIEQELQTALSIPLPDKERFYVSKRSSFESIQAKFQESSKTYRAEINKILEQLQARQKDIFKIKRVPEVNDISEELQKNIEALNQLIESNNSTAGDLPRKQQDARNELRLNNVAGFIRDIDLDAEEKRVTELQNEAKSSKDAVDTLTQNVRELENEIKELQSKLQDEKKGAEKVNEYLNHFFGHKGLQLEAVEDLSESKFKFQISRGAERAYDMSEGECSLVSFCYFIARLEDAETKGKDLIVYIDDPISSLDSNHIFFLFSLIESVIAKPERGADGSKNYLYNQLFVSTHNLDFFKYLMRLSRPDNKQGGTEFFLIEQEGGESSLRIMPKYLQNYQTEFIYLFHQIYRCRNSHNAHENHEIFYNFGNNLRKFLEAYLFYKYPHKDDKDKETERLLKFFGGDATATALTNRVDNELSHLEEIFDRSMQPIEIPEIPAVANFVLNKMYEKDKEQFNALLQSIGEPVREENGG